MAFPARKEGKVFEVVLSPREAPKTGMDVRNIRGRKAEKILDTTFKRVLFNFN